MLILDVLQEAGALLDEGPALEVLDEEPLVWEPEHVYLYPLDVNTYGVETRGGVDDTATARQDFAFRVVYVTRSKDEARQKRQADLAFLLDDKRAKYLSLLITHPRLPQTDANLLRARVDTTRPRMLDKRSAAVRFEGWRLIPLAAGGS